jgi:hypothetical protein
MSKETKRRGGHYILMPGLLSEAVVEGLARQQAQKLVAAQDAWPRVTSEPKMPQKILEVDSRLED